MPNGIISFFNMQLLLALFYYGPMKPEQAREKMSTQGIPNPHNITDRIVGEALASYEDEGFAIRTGVSYELSEKGRRLVMLFDCELCSKKPDDVAHLWTNKEFNHKFNI